MEIHRIDFSDISAELPDLTQFEPSSDYDLVIATLGFEDRTHHVISQLATIRPISSSQLLLIRYPTNRNENDVNLPRFQEAISGTEPLQELIYSKRTFFTDLKDSLTSYIKSGQRKVIVDISTCSSYVFYPMMKVLWDLGDIYADIELTLAYSEAEHYYPAQDEWERVREIANAEKSLFVRAFENAAFQSLGVEDIYPSPVFSEMNAGNRPTLLVAVPNFSAMRMNAIIARDNELNKTSDRNIIWLIGEPPGKMNRWRKDALKDTYNLDNVEGSIRYISTLDYKETLTTLEDLWLKYKYDLQMTIGSLGSKMQHVGIFVFLLLHNEIGLWLAEPKEFKASRFSAGWGSSWQLKISPLKSFSDRLKKYGQFSWRL